MKLFTKDIDKKLFQQYQMGNNLEEQVVVSKIFNPYGNGRWFLINSDPNDPDYLWAIVQMGDVVEMGSVSRKELESLRVGRFKFPLERDLGFSSVNAMQLYEGLNKGKFYEKGGMAKGSYMANGGAVKWQDAKIGDSALVKSENKMGLILKDYGRKFHLKFVDGTQKTYDASELEFIKDEYADGGYMADGGGIAESNNMVLEKIKNKYSKLYPKFKWELKKESKTNYSPSSDNIYFESDKLYPLRFIQIENYSGYREDISKKFGQYKLNIYLHPILEIYGEDTPDQNPTISKYFKEYPTESEIKKELGKKESTWFTKMADGGYMENGGVLKVSKGENGKYYWKFTFKNGKEEKSFDGFNSSADAQRDFQYRSKYFKMADGGYMAKGGETDKKVSIKDLEKQKNILLTKASKMIPRSPWRMKIYRLINDLDKQIENFDKGNTMSMGGSISNFNPMELIGKYFISKFTSGDITNVRILSNDNIKIEYEASSGLMIEKSFTKEELFDMINGQEINGNYIVTPKSKMSYGGYMEHGGETKEDFLEDIAEMHENIKEITLKDGTKISGKELMDAHKMECGGMYYAKGGNVKNYIYIKKSDIKEIKALVNGVEKTFTTNDILDGAYVKKSSKVSKTATKKSLSDKEIQSIAEQMMDINSDAWDKIDINSGSELYSDKSKQELYAKYLSTKGLDSLYRKLSPKDRDRVSEVLTDENYHSLNNYLALRGYRNEGKWNDAYDYYYEQSVNQNNKLVLDAKIITRIEFDKGSSKNTLINTEQTAIKGNELGTFKDARYAKGKILYIPPTSEKGAWKNRQSRLAEAKGISGKWTHREHGYIMSKSQAEKLKKYILEGYDAEYITGKIEKPEFSKGGELNGTIAGDAAKYIAKDLSYYVKGIVEQPNDEVTYFHTKDKLSVNKIIKSLKDLYGIEASSGGDMFFNWNTVKFDNDQIVETKMAKGGVTFDEKVKSISKSLVKRKKVAPSVQKDYGKTYNKKEAVESAKRIAGSMRAKEMAKKKN